MVTSQTSHFGRPYGSATDEEIITQSRLANMGCMKRDFLRYVKGVKPKADAISFRIGKAAHKMMEHYYMNGSYATLVQKCKALAHSLPEDLFEPFTTWISNYLTLNSLQKNKGSIFIPELLMKGPIVSEAKKFKKVLIAGKIDLLWFEKIPENEDGKDLILKMADHKTTKQKPNPTEKDWPTQLMFYYLLWMQYLTRPRKFQIVHPYISIEERKKKWEELLLHRTANIQSPRFYNNVLVRSTAKKPNYTEENFPLIEVPGFHKAMDRMLVPYIGQAVEKIRKCKREAYWPENPFECVSFAGYAKKCVYYDLCVMGDESKFVSCNPFDELT